MGPEFLHGLALEDAQQAAVGVDDLLPLAGPVDEKTAGHLVHKVDKRAGHPVLLGEFISGGAIRLAQHPQDLFYEKTLMRLVAHGSNSSLLR